MPTRNLSVVVIVDGMDTLAAALGAEVAAHGQADARDDHAHLLAVAVEAAEDQALLDVGLAEGRHVDELLVFVVHLERLLMRAPHGGEA